jgi:exodeoxyribonuclease VII small subunit
VAANQSPEKNEPEPAASFEKSLSELEEIVSQLEAGEKPLDESLSLYERGVAALKRCHLVLDKAEKRIRTLVRGADGEPALRETEMPNKPPSNRSRAPKAAPASEETTKESAPPEPEKEKNSSEQAVDSGDEGRQNVPTTGNSKSRTGNGKPNAGGSLFGNTQ